MQIFIWAFGAMLILMLIIAFLPFGFTLKGKFLVTMASFLLALGGLSVGTFLPLMQTSLIVLLFVLAVAYIMDSRIGPVIYNQGLDSFDIELEEELETIITDNKIEKSAELELLDLNQIETDFSSLLKIDENEDISTQMHLQTVVANNHEDIDIDTEDISFLNELLKDEINIKKDTESDGDYLSDIESLLLDDSEEKTKLEDEGWLEELNVLNPSAEMDEKVSITAEDNELEELFLAVKEAATWVEEDLTYLNDDTKTDTGYLSDIENLLLEETEDKTESENEDWLEELNVLKQVTDEEEMDSSISENYELQELFLEEVTVGDEKNLKFSDIKKEVSLQK